MFVCGMIFSQCACDTAFIRLLLVSHETRKYASLANLECALLAFGASWATNPSHYLLSGTLSVTLPQAREPRTPRIKLACLFDHSGCIALSRDAPKGAIQAARSNSPARPRRSSALVSRTPKIAANCPKRGPLWTPNSTS